ncbi:MAG: MFS transporter [Deltaproteobacteria bacterium]|nr:MFS transporter [Deltaproteobacteria bacterium]
MWKKLPQNLKVLLGSMILANIGGRVFRPFMPLYILALGGDIAQVGVFFTVDTVLAAIMRPFGGWISDSIGRLQAVGIGTLFGLTGFIGYALSPTWEWLMVATIAIAVGRAMVGPSFRAFTAESAPEGQVAQTFGLVNGIFSVVDIIGPALGGWIVLQYGLHSIFWVGVGFFAMASALRVAIARRQPYHWEQVQVSQLQTSVKGLWAGLVGGGLLTWIFLDDSLFDFGNQLHYNLQTILLDTNGYSEDQIGLLFSLLAVVYTLTSFIASRLADRFNAVAVLFLGDIIQGLALIFLISGEGLFLFPVYFILTGIGSGIAEPAFDKILVRAAPKEQLGLTFGLFRSVSSFLSMPAPYIGSLLWEKYSPETPFLFGSVFIFIGLGVLWFILRPIYDKVMVTTSS